MPGDSNHVANIQKPVELEAAFSNNVQLYVDLQSHALPENVREPGFAMAPQAHQTAAYLDGDFFGVKLLRRARAERDKISAGVCVKSKRRG